MSRYCLLGGEDEEDEDEEEDDIVFSLLCEIPESELRLLRFFVGLMLKLLFLECKELSDLLCNREFV